MSTEYVCYWNDTTTTQNIGYPSGSTAVTLDEHSGLLDLSVKVKSAEVWVKNMTPAEVADMAIKMLLAAHYQDGEAVEIAACKSSEQYAMGISL